MEDIVQRVITEARRRGIVIHEDNIIRQAIDNIAENMRQRDVLNGNEPPPLVRYNREAGDAARMNDIIAEIQRLQQERRGQAWGPDGQTPAHAPDAPDASAADEGLSVSPPQRTEEDPHPPRGGSRKVKKTKSSKKHPAARRRRSSKAARKSRKARKARSTRRR